MPVAPTYPGVYIEELPSPVHTISGVATSIAAFVGYTASGIDNRAQQILSFADYERLYGPLASDSELSYAVQQFFSNGGSQAYVVRTPRAGATGAQAAFAAMTFTALSSGSWANNSVIIDTDVIGVDPTDSKAFNLTITNLVDGTIEKFPKVTLDPTKKNYVSAVVNDIDMGSELVKVVVGTVTTAPVTTGIVGAAGALTTMAAGMGAVTSIPGTVATTAASKNVVGTGTTFTTKLTPGQFVTVDADTTPYQVDTITDDTHLALKTAYPTAVTGKTLSVVGAAATANKDYSLILTTTNPSAAPAPLPLTIKIFPKNAPVPQSIVGVAAQVQQVINTALGVAWPGAYVLCSASGSGLRLNAYLPGSNIDAVVSFGTVATSATLGDAAAILGLTTPASSNVAHYALGTGHAWGSQTSSTAGGDGSGLPGTAGLLGDQGSFTGIYALDKIDLFNILCIPDATRADPSDQYTLDSAVDPVAIYSTAISYCDARRAMLLLDCPPPVKNPSAALDWKSSTIGVHDKNGACYFPRLRLADPLNNYQLRTFAPCGVVAGLWSRIDASRGVWKAPAGTEAILTGVQSLVYKLSDAENGVLNPLAVNCFRSFPIYGNIAWGARTLVGTDAEGDQWKYIPVRRLALYIEESLYRGTKWAVFEPNDEPLWSQLRLNVGGFMHDLFRKGAFQGQTPNDSYLVKCDKDTTTQNDIDQGRVNILVAFAPLKPAEFIVIQIQQMAGQVQS
jgi:phage tail sheath protein FI